MVNHPRRSHGPYVAELYSPHTNYEPHSCQSLRAARAWAEAHGDAADVCTVLDSAGKSVAQYRRDRADGGQRWFRAECLD